MRAGALIRPPMSEGERRVALAYAVIALVGGILAFLIVVRLRDDAFFARPMGVYDLWIVASGALGGIGGLWLGRARFGHAGLPGLLRALGGVATTTLSAPVIAGTLALPLYGTMFAPMLLAVTFAGAPAVALVWLATLASVHVLFATFRAERATIFAPLPTRGTDNRGAVTRRRGSSG